MRGILVSGLLAVFLTGSAYGAGAPAKGQKQEDVLGITVFGNRDGPKSMVVMPWRDATQAEMAGFRLENVLSEEMAPLDPDQFKVNVELHELVKKSLPGK